MVRTFLPKAALLVLILLLATPAAQAAEPGAALPSVFSQVWDFLTRVWAYNGCRLDPDGRCLPGQTVKAEADNGCGLDPDGRCAH